MTVRASIAKNRKKSVLPLPEGTLKVFRKLRGTKKANTLVFKSLPIPRTLYGDLKKAGIARVTPRGVFDFHAFRVTFATTLARADVPLVLAQKLLRHSKPELTANIYTRLEIGDSRRAVANFDDFGLTQKEEEDLSAVVSPQVTELQMASKKLCLIPCPSTITTLQEAALDNLESEHSNTRKK